MVSRREDFDQLITSLGAEHQWSCTSDQIELSLLDGRRQQVHFEYFDHEQVAMVRFYTRIGSTRRIQTERLVFALELNWKMPHGAMAVQGDTLALVETMPLAGASGPKVASVVVFLAEMADQYEKSMFGQDDY